MRTSHHHSVSSAGRVSAWLVAALGLAAYVGLIYGLTVFPLQFELPVPQWATFAVPAVAYGVLGLLFVRRPSIIRWVVGTALLTGLHVALLMARGPLSVMLDPALAGRPLPWMLPPPLPELVGGFLLLGPLRRPPPGPPGASHASACPGRAAPRPACGLAYRWSRGCRRLLHPTASTPRRT